MSEMSYIEEGSNTLQMEDADKVMNYFNNFDERRAEYGADKSLFEFFCHTLNCKPVRNWDVVGSAVEDFKTVMMSIKRSVTPEKRQELSESTDERINNMYDWLELYCTNRLNIDDEDKFYGSRVGIQAYKKAVSTMSKKTLNDEYLGLNMETLTSMIPGYTKVADMDNPNRENASQALTTIGITTEHTVYLTEPTVGWIDTGMLWLGDKDLIQTRLNMKRLPVRGQRLQEIIKQLYSKFGDEIQHRFIRIEEGALTKKDNYTIELTPEDDVILTVKLRNVQV